MEANREIEKNLGAQDSAFFVIKAGGDMPDDVVKLCRVMGMFEEE